MNKYINIENWLNECNTKKIYPWLWDFKEELHTVNGNKIGCLDDSKSSIINMFNWYLSNEVDSSEVEGSNTANEIYILLWNVSKHDLQKNIISTDIMNSFWQIYKIALNLYYNIPITYLRKWIYVNNKLVINKPLFNELKNNYNKYNKVNVLFEQYAFNTHTLGNFSIIPIGFNTGRKNNDFWDMALILLKSYFDSISQDFWIKYIQSNYLYSFVDDKYNILPLWKITYQIQI